MAAAQPAQETRPALPGSEVCVGRGGCCACERGGRPVCFDGLAAAGLLENLSQLLAGAVWACLGSGSHQQSETRLHSAQWACRDPGTQGWAGGGGQTHDLSCGAHQGSGGGGCALWEVTGEGDYWWGLRKTPFLGSFQLAGT